MPCIPLHRASRTPGAPRARAALAAVLAASALLAVPLAAQSGRDTTELPALVVTATREPGALRTQPATVTVLHGATLRAEGITHLGDALRRLPGLAVLRQSSFGSPTSLFLRGGQSNYVRLLVDGVPVNEPGGTLDLGRIPLDEIDRIEVVRGPASVLYGSEAVAGVIQVLTRRASERPRLDAELGGGSFGAQRASLGAAGDAGAFAWSLRGDHHGTDGILAFNNAYRNDGLTASIGTAGRDGRTDARLIARYNASQYQYPTSSDGSVSDLDAERTEHRTLIGLDAGHRWTHRAETRVQLSFNELHPRTSDGPDDASDDEGFYGYFARATVARHQADLRSTFRMGEAQRVSIGAEYAREAERGSSLSLSEFGDFPDEFRARRENVALYSQVLGDVGRWSYTVGGRLDENSAFGTFRTVRVGAAYRVTEALRMRSSAGSAFKAPNFFETFAQGLTVGNPDLRPERSRSIDAGVEADLQGGVTLALTAFTQRFTDLVQYTGTPPAPDEPNYYNIAAANAGGLEVEARLADLFGFAAAASYTWTDTRVVDAGFSSAPNDNFVTGGRLLRRPQHAASLHLSRQVGSSGTVHATAMHTGEREDRDFSDFPAGIVFLSAYTTLDLGAELRLSPLLGSDARVQLRVENVTNEAYEAVHGFRTPGRAWYVGLKLRR